MDQLGDELIVGGVVTSPWIPAHEPHRRVCLAVSVVVSRTAPVAAFADVQNMQRHPIE